jgi:hypothetical protein
MRFATCPEIFGGKGHHNGFVRNQKIEQKSTIAALMKNSESKMDCSSVGALPGFGASS